LWDTPEAVVKGHPQEHGDGRAGWALLSSSWRSPITSLRPNASIDRLPGLLMPSALD